MFRKLDELLKRYKFLSEELAKPEILSDMDVWKKYSKEQFDLTETVEKYEEYLTVEREMQDAFALADARIIDAVRLRFLDSRFPVKR